MNKFNFNKLTPFKWFILENFPFIEADFDALTEWQLFCKLGKEMNKIINSENTLGTQMENVTNAFIDLQNYINNYFDNLDVQEEINTKLNEMVEDGTLAEIINQEIFNELNEKINNSVSFKNNENDTSETNFKFKNIDISVDYKYNSLIYLIKLNKIEKLSLLPSGMNFTTPETGVQSPYDLAQINNDFDLFINGGVFNPSTNRPVGKCIFDGILYNDTDSVPPYYGGLDSNNNLLAISPDNINTAQDLVNFGFKNCCGMFKPVIYNGLATDVSQEIEPAYNYKQPRQLLMQDINNNLYIMSVIGRQPYSQGMTFSEIANYLNGKNIKTCLTLDGGGSTQTIYNKKAFFTSQDLVRKTGRVVSNVFAFKIKNEMEV